VNEYISGIITIIMDWRTRRKIIFGVIGAFLLCVIIAIPTYIIFFTGIPTCSDLTQNGDERGVDCGGVCARVCKIDVKPLVIKSADVFKVSDGIYNGLALVTNENQEAGAFAVPYTFTVVDNVGRNIDKSTGKIDIPANSTVAIFAGSIRIKNEKAGMNSSVTFGEIPEWTKMGPKNPEVTVSVSKIIDEDTKPRIDGKVSNDTEVKTETLKVVAVISDDSGTPIGVSSTVVDPLVKDQSRQIFFAWPEPFTAGSRLCDPNSGRKISSFLGDVAIVIDRSGSMEFESKNPPEPLNTVLLSAIKFAESLRGTDMGALVTFADDATIDLPLTKTFDDLIQKIDSVTIGTKGIQNTNFGEGIKKATDILLGTESKNKRKALVILTDGVATRPIKSGDKNYPETYSTEMANIAKSKDIEIYVIGLGKTVNSELLKTIASSPDNYYGADKKEKLATIYDSIATSICSKRPGIVNTYVVKAN